MLLEFLRKIEWDLLVLDGFPACPSCMNINGGQSEHRKDCVLAHLIFQLEQQKRSKPAVRMDTHIFNGDPNGLYDKFMVIREDGSKHHVKDAKYFVLDIAHDRVARIAAYNYAEVIKNDCRQLAEDLVKELNQIERAALPRPGEPKCPTCNDSGRLVDGANCGCKERKPK